MSEMYVANRDVTVTSTTGHTIRFTKDVPQAVPFDIRRACLEHGVLPVDGTPPVIEDGAPPPPPKTPMSLGERDELILEAVKDMMEAKKRSDFTAAGLPRVDQISKILGFEINPAERDRVWMEIKRG